MNKDFILYMDKHFVVFDGAMGTMLQEKGLTSDQCPEQWNIDHPDIVKEIYRGYKKAGSDVIETNTFGANALKLARYGLENEVERINREAVKLAKEVMGRDGWVAVSVGPTGHMMQPFGDLAFEQAYDAFRQQILAAAEAGVDIVCVETMSDVNEARAALLAAKENVSLPVICTMTFETNGHTLMGNDPASAAIVLSAAGADVVGINCSGGVEVAYEAIKAMTSYSSVPLMVQPNAGMPKRENGQTVYPMGPNEMLRWTDAFVEAGVTILGGCCGTTPAHIKLLADKFKGKVIPPRAKKGKRYISSGYRSVPIDEIKSQCVLNVSSADDMMVAVMEAAGGNFDAMVLDFEGWRGDRDNVYSLLKDITSINRKPLVFKNVADDVLTLVLRYYGGIAGVIGHIDDELLQHYGAVSM